MRSTPCIFAILLGMTISNISCSRAEEKGPSAGEQPLTAAKAPESDYQYQLTVGDMSFSWKLQAESMGVELSAKTKGWLGIGFNPESGQDMKGANIVIGFVKDGKVDIQDHFGTLKTNHKPDEKVGGASHVTNAAGKEDGGISRISFSMPLKSGDATDSSVDVDKDTMVLLAFGKSDSIILKHKFRAILKVNLSTGQYSVVKVR